MTSRKPVQIISTICLLVFLISAVAVFGETDSRPRPPRKLKYLFENFREIEEAHRDAEWSEAEETLNDFSEGLDSMEAQIVSAGGTAALAQCRDEIENYFELLDDRASAEDSEDDFMELEGSFFSLTDLFKYGTPPILDFFIEQFGEFKEEVLVEGEWDEAESEINEIEEFWELIVEGYLSDLPEADDIAEEIESDLEDLSSIVERQDAREATLLIRRILVEVENIKTIMKS